MTEFDRGGVAELRANGGWGLYAPGLVAPGRDSNLSLNPPTLVGEWWARLRRAPATGFGCGGAAGLPSFPLSVLVIGV